MLTLIMPITFRLTKHRVDRIEPICSNLHNFVAPMHLYIFHSLLQKRSQDNTHPYLREGIAGVYHLPHQGGNGHYDYLYVFGSDTPFTYMYLLTCIQPTV